MPERINLCGELLKKKTLKKLWNNKTTQRSCEIIPRARCGESIWGEKNWLTIGMIRDSSWERFVLVMLSTTINIHAYIWQSIHNSSFTLRYGADRWGCRLGCRGLGFVSDEQFLQGLWMDCIQLDLYRKAGRVLFYLPLFFIYLLSVYLTWNTFYADLAPS